MPITPISPKAEHGQAVSPPQLSAVGFQPLAISRTSSRLDLTPLSFGQVHDLTLFRHVHWGTSLKPDL